MNSIRAAWHWFERPAVSAIFLVLIVLLTVVIDNTNILFGLTLLLLFPNLVMEVERLVLLLQYNRTERIFLDLTGFFDHVFSLFYRLNLQLRTNERAVALLVRDSFLSLIRIDGCLDVRRDESPDLLFFQKYLSFGFDFLSGCLN